jgi:hypothetical protein
MNKFKEGDIVISSSLNIPVNLRNKRGIITSVNIQIPGFYGIHFTVDPNIRSDYALMENELTPAYMFKEKDIVKCLVGNSKDKICIVKSVNSYVYHIQEEFTSNNMMITNHDNMELVWSYCDFKEGDFVELLHLKKQEGEGDNFSKMNGLELYTQYKVSRLTDPDNRNRKWLRLKGYNGVHHPHKFRLWNENNKQPVQMTMNLNEPTATERAIDIKNELLATGWNWVGLPKLSA